jgi:inorganic pyrophosphatase
LIYPVDYGYLENTSSMDGGGIDVWKSTDGNAVDAIICTVGLMKRDSELKSSSGVVRKKSSLFWKSITTANT